MPLPLNVAALGGNDRVGDGGGSCDGCAGGEDDEAADDEGDGVPRL